MSEPSQPSRGGPDETPSAARMYDYYLGGHHNFPADRAAAEAAMTIYPDLAPVARVNRAFLRRAVTLLAARGIDQFLDLGSGIPTVGNVHEVAQQSNPAARVVYVDNDPVAVTHSAALLGDSPTVAVIEADARRPEMILEHPATRRLLDTSRPLALLMLTFLHFVTDDGEATRLAQQLRDALAPGSYLVISHGTSEVPFTVPPATEQRMKTLYARTSNAVKPRSRAEIAAFFGDWPLVEPGLVYTSLWRPEGSDDLFLDEPGRSGFFAGMARKP